MLTYRSRKAKSLILPRSTCTAKSKGSFRISLLFSLINCVNYFRWATVLTVVTNSFLMGTIREKYGSWKKTDNIKRNSGGALWQG